ncbi:transglycosylase SLT domain-containing protein [Luteimonas sp. FXH3W]|uniref:Transglycosylase SLT domain-containing protein n=1 Tax=Aquilutibacter rugosus TaxID=3115820 RepID=A0ABU7UVV8_9GAMM
MDRLGFDRRGGAAAVRILFAALALALVGNAAHAQVPADSTRYRLQLEREAVRNFGLTPPITVLAAQIHQESSWNPKAASAFAQGLAQFTPATAKWLPQVCPAVGTPDVWDPAWSLRAHACYDAWLYRRVTRYAAPTPPLSTCDRLAFMLRAYNGGEGWLNRERKLAFEKGANPNSWKAVAAYRVRAGWAHKENTEYPHRILTVLEPRYYNAGWERLLPCA